MSDKRFSSVTEMVDSVVGDESLVESIDKQVSSREVVSALATLRVAHGVSQSQIADELGCKQGRVSKIENGVDTDLRLSHLAAYAKTTGHEVLVTFPRAGNTHAEQVKFHAFGIKDSLDKMVALAHKDSQIADGVAQFHVEALLNLVRLLESSAKDLPGRSDNNGPLLKIVVNDAIASETSCVTEAIAIESALC